MDGNSTFQKEVFLEQLKDRMFGEMLLYKEKNMFINSVMAAFMKLSSKYGEDACAELIDSVNSRATEDLFRTKCDDVYFLVEAMISTIWDDDFSDEEVFDLFEIVLLNFVYGMHQSPDLKRRIKKVVYPNFFKRLME